MRDTGRSATVLSSLLLFACIPPPLDYGPNGRVTDPRVAFDSVVARREKITAVQGETRVSAETPNGGGSLTQYVIAQTPDRLRLEAVTIFGNPVAVLSSDGQRYAFFDVEHGQFFEGPATASNISRLLPTAIPPDELVSLLLGIPPLPKDAQPVALDIDEQRRTYALTLASGAHRMWIGLDPRTLRPLWVRFPQRDKLGPYFALLSDFDDKTELPKLVKLTGSDPKAFVELKWKEREINPELEPDVFLQEPPENAREIFRE